MFRYTILLFALMLSFAEAQAVQPYQPVHPDPVLEPWRWRSFPELKGLGLECMAEDKAGNMWFGVDDGAVSYDGVKWTTYTPEDGLLGAPVQTLCATRDGSVYTGTVLGISRFRDGRWDRVFPDEGACDVFDLLEGSDGSLWAGTSLGAVHFSREQTTLYTTDSLRTVRPELNVTFVALPEGAEPRVYDVYEDREGRMWFGLYGGEILRYDIGCAESGASTPWRLYTAEDGLDVGSWPRIAQTPDQSIWTVSERAYGGVNRFDGQAWTHFRLSDKVVAHNSNPSVLVTQDGTLWVGGHWSNLYAYGVSSWVGSIHRSDEDHLWVGTRSDGIFRFNGQTWQHYSEQDGLAAGRIRDILQTEDGSIWASTPEGISRFDGQAWTTHALPLDLTGPELWQSRDGALWIFGMARSIRYRPDVDPPETEITLSLDEVSQPGNTTLAWKGTDAWGDTPDEALQYAWRMDRGGWSAYSGKTSDVFLALGSGDHIFEAKTRDRDFNEDPTPASVTFPWTNRPWRTSFMWGSTIPPTASIRKAISRRNPTF